MNLEEIEKRMRARVDLTLMLLNDASELDAELKKSMKTSATPIDASRKRRRLRRLMNGLIKSI